MANFRVGGQCEGYGGIFEALRSLIPVEHAWLAETDPDACRVLEHRYPGVKNLGDITSVDWPAAERVDIFTSGFPCQPVSSAGKRKGAADSRYLWPSGVAPAIAALRPPLVVLENVRGLLSADGGAIFGQVIADLDALGYAVSWSVVGACMVGACHHRHRVFIVATLASVEVPAVNLIARRGADGGWESGQDVLFGEPAAAPKWPPAGVVAGGRVWSRPAHVCGTRAGFLPTPAARDSEHGKGWPEQHGRPGRPLSEVAALLPTPRASDTGTAGRRASEGWRPPLSEVLFKLLPTVRASSTTGRCVHGEGSADLQTVMALLPTPRASDRDKGSPNQHGSRPGDLMLPSAVQPERFGVYADAVHRHEQAFGMAAPPPTTTGRNGQPRLSAAFAEWMQGLPPGWLTDVVGFGPAIRLAGNGVNPRQCAFAVGSSPVFQGWLDFVSARSTAA